MKQEEKSLVHRENNSGDIIISLIQEETWLSGFQKDNFITVGNDLV